MTNFFAGIVLGFLACAWAVETSPSVAAAALWQHLEQVQQTSASAYEAYDNMRVARERHEDKLDTQPADYR